MKNNLSLCFISPPSITYIMNYTLTQNTRTKPCYTYKIITTLLIFAYLCGITAILMQTTNCNVKPLKLQYSLMYVHSRRN